MEQYTDRSSLPNVRVKASLGLPLRREHQCGMSVDSCAVVIWNVMQHMVSCETEDLKVTEGFLQDKEIFNLVSITLVSLHFGL